MQLCYTITVLQIKREKHLVITLVLDTHIKCVYKGET